MQQITDEQLIHWIANGDTTHLSVLFERHHRDLFRYCFQLTHNHSLSEDVVQDVFVKLLKKAASFKGEGCFRAWLFHIARNTAFDQLRKRERSMHFDSEYDSQQSLAEEYSTEQAAAGKQHLELVAQALAAIPTAARDVIWLGRFVCNDYEELAQALGCKAGAARVRMHRAMQQLNESFAQINGAPIDV